MTSTKVTAEAEFRLQSTSPVNLEKRTGYTLALTAPRLTTTISLGHLQSCIVNSATLTVPGTRKFGVSFVAKPESGALLEFGGYTIYYEDGGLVLNYYDDTNGDNAIGSVTLTDDRTRRFSVSFDGESVGIRIEDHDYTFEAPVDEEISSIVILDDGGILDSVHYWSRPISEVEHRQLLSDESEINENLDITRITVDELLQYPHIHVVTGPGDGNFARDAISWIPMFDSATEFIVNNNSLPSGFYLDFYPEDISVENGTVLVAEYLDGTIDLNQYAELVVGGIAPGTHVHPVYRSRDVGSRGGIIASPQDDAAPLLSVSFWVDPTEGDIMDGVTMASGVVTGATFINGAAYSGGVLEDRFMVTKNNPGANFVIYADATNLVADDVVATAASAKALYESFFILPKISTLPDTVAVSDDDVFIIDATWSIINSG